MLKLISAAVLGVVLGGLVMGILATRSSHIWNQLNTEFTIVREKALLEMLEAGHVSEVASLLQQNICVQTRHLITLPDSSPWPYTAELSGHAKGIEEFGAYCD